MSLNWCYAQIMSSSSSSAWLREIEKSLHYEIKEKKLFATPKLRLLLEEAVLSNSVTFLDELKPHKLRPVIIRGLFVLCAKYGRSDIMIRLTLMLRRTSHLNLRPVPRIVKYFSDSTDNLCKIICLPEYYRGDYRKREELLRLLLFVGYENISTSLLRQVARHDYRLGYILLMESSSSCQAIWKQNLSLLRDVLQDAIEFQTCCTVTQHEDMEIFIECLFQKKFHVSFDSTKSLILKFTGIIYDAWVNEEMR